MCFLEQSYDTETVCLYQIYELPGVAPETAWK